ncbi:unnamed protein product, partial [Phaeothamnion confervicola]
GRSWIERNVQKSKDADNTRQQESKIRYRRRRGLCGAGLVGTPLAGSKGHLFFGGICRAWREASQLDVIQRSAPTKTRLQAVVVSVARLIWDECLRSVATSRKLFNGPARMTPPGVGISPSLRLKGANGCPRVQSVLHVGVRAGKLKVVRAALDYNCPGVEYLG